MLSQTSGGFQFSGPRLNTNWRNLGLRCRIKILTRKLMEQTESFSVTVALIHSIQGDARPSLQTKIEFHVAYLFPLI